MAAYAHVHVRQDMSVPWDTQARINHTFPLVMLSQYRNRQNHQFPSLRSAADSYKNFGRYQLNYHYVQRKKLRDLDALITVHEYNYMRCLFHSSTHLSEAFIGGLCLLEGSISWNKYDICVPLVCCCPRGRTVGKNS